MHWGAWLSACFKLEMACFPEEWNNAASYCLFSCILSNVITVTKAAALLKSGIHSKMFARSPLFPERCLTSCGLQPSPLCSSVVMCCRHLVRPCSLGSVCVKRVKEEAGKHPRDHVNTTHRSHREWRLRNSAFL